MSDFLKAQFDKLLLLTIIVFFTLVLLLLLYRFPNLDQSTLQWIEKSVDMATGGLIVAVNASSKRQDPPPGSVTEKKELTITPPEKS